MKMKLKAHSVDEFGVKNYNSLYLLLLALILLYSLIALLSFGLVSVESTAANSNITSYKDAFWTLQMSASTIGFGDFYPVTFEGRIIVAAMFYLGVGVVGFIGAQFIDRFVGFSDTNVKNRELRRQNAKILEQNIRIEAKLDTLLSQTAPEEVAQKSKATDD